MNNIYEKLKVDFQYITGFAYKGLVASIGAGFASRLAEFNDKLKFIEKQAFIATADKDYLYLKAGKMLPPKPSETAEGSVVFYGENGATIGIGTEVADEKGTFKTISDVSIEEVTISGSVEVVDGMATMVYVGHGMTSITALVDGIQTKIIVVDSDTLMFQANGLETGDSADIVVSMATASVISNEAGEIGNRELNDILKTKITIDGVNKELGVKTISGGIDEEDIEVYRKRVMYFMSRPQAPFSKSNIIAINKESIETLKYMWVKGGEVENGKVGIIALNTSHGLTTEEREKIFDNTRAIAPANADPIDIIRVTNADVSLIDIVIEDLTPVSDTLKEKVEKNIKYYYDKDMYEKDIAKSELEAIIYKTTNGAEEVKSFTLVSGWRSAEENIFWEINNVVFQ